MFVLGANVFAVAFRNLVPECPHQINQRIVLGIIRSDNERLLGLYHGRKYIVFHLSVETVSHRSPRLLLSPGSRLT